MRTSLMQMWCCGLLLLCSSGCATVIHGTEQTIPITSTPPGAKVTIEPSDTALTTPGAATLKRKEMYRVRFTLESHHPQDAFLAPHSSGAVWGNIILGGAPGIMVDLLNGAAFELRPHKLHVEMRPSESETTAAPDIIQKPTTADQ